MHMKYKITGTRGGLPFEISADRIDCDIKEHSYTDELQFTEYILDETGEICGLKGRADLGHGYGFNYGWKAFTIKPGETYAFTHAYTSIEGPSDWTEDSFHVILRLEESES